MSTRTLRQVVCVQTNILLNPDHLVKVHFSLIKVNIKADLVAVNATAYRR